MIPTAILDGHLTRVCGDSADIPTSFYFMAASGTVVSGAMSTPSMTQEVEMGGPDDKIESNLFVRASDLTAAPKMGAEIVAGAIHYRIAGINLSSDGVLYTLALVFARKGAAPYA